MKILVMLMWVDSSYNKEKGKKILPINRMFWFVLLLSVFHSEHLMSKDLEKSNSVSQRHETIFTKIYKGNSWNDSESVSGPGSNVKATRKIRNELQGLLEQFAITSLLDVPCGDFNWMKLIDFNECNYLGVDIVKELIQQNERLYGNSKRKFSYLDAINDSLPQVDLIFCRDLFVHLNLKDVLRALENFKKSGSHYLLVTTHVLEKKNKDIKTGRWRKINFEKAPFNFPKPLLLIKEDSPEKDEYDKCLGLWLIEDVLNK